MLKPASPELSPWPLVPAPSQAHLEAAPGYLRPLLARLPSVANGVIEHGPDRGFYADPVWHPGDFQAWNARPYEIHVLFAWFFCTPGAWNPYYANPALKVRLEAMLAKLISLQTPSGGLPEFHPGRITVAATASGAQWLAETLRLLKSGPPIDPALHFDAVHAARRAILCLLSGRVADYSHAGQWEPVWPAALCYLAAHPGDTEVRLHALHALQRTRNRVQSHAGYLYAASAPDWGHDCNAHSEILEHAMLYARDTAWSPYFVEKERRRAEWLAYNAVPETDGLVCNMSINSRTEQNAFLPGFATSLAREVSLLRACPPRTGSAPADGVRAGFTPHVYYDLIRTRWRPNEEQRESARSQLPCLAGYAFSHARRDQFRADTYLYVRRKSYYAVFNACEAAAAAQRFGLGLLWHPRAGTLLLSRRATATETWGTLVGNHLQECGIANPEFSLNGVPLELRAGNRDLPAGEPSVRYALGKGPDRKTVTFCDDALRVSVRKAGAFVECVPLLLLPGSTLFLADGGAVLEHPACRLRLIVAFQDAEGSVRHTSVRYGRKTLAMLEIRAEGRLDYSLAVEVEALAASSHRRPASTAGAFT